MKTLKAISLETSLWTKLEEISKRGKKSVSKIIEELLTKAIEKTDKKPK